MTVLNTHFKYVLESQRHKLDYSRWLDQPTEQIRVVVPTIAVLNSTTVLPDTLIVTVVNVDEAGQWAEYVVTKGVDGIHYRVTFTGLTTFDDFVQTVLDFRIGTP